MAAAVALPIFEQLGENRVTHPIDVCERYQEGYITEQVQFQKPVSKDTKLAGPIQTPVTERLMTQLMFWKIPSTTLLPNARVAEEIKRFKEDLVKTASHFDTKLMKTHDLDAALITQQIISDTPSNSLFEFLGLLWDCLFVTETAICGTDPIDSTPAYVMQTSGEMTLVTDIREVRSKLILKQFENLKTAKDYKELFASLKLPLTKIDPETHRRRALLKSELQHIVSSYIKPI